MCHEYIYVCVSVYVSMCVWHECVSVCVCMCMWPLEREGSFFDLPLSIQHSVRWLMDKFQKQESEASEPRSRRL